MTIRVVLTGTRDRLLEQPPGRLMLVHADHAFADLAEAIDVAFARWDLSHLHQFDVEGRRLIAAGGDALDGDAEDSDEVTVGEVGLRAGTRFSYTFDLGDGWTHECTVEEVTVDPIEAYGEEPAAPVPIWGWGAIPDQYGRVSDDEYDDVDDNGAAREEAEARTVVRDALEGIERRVDDDDVAAASGRLRAHADDDDGPYAVLWEAADLGAEGPPSDDRELWIELAAGVVSPSGPLPIDVESEAAWASLEPADWAGAVIELVRAGVGQPAEPQDLLALMAACPEVGSDDVTANDEAVIALGLEPVVELLVALGALDDERRLTALGRWGLPEALDRAWS